MKQSQIDICVNCKNVEDFFFSKKNPEMIEDKVQQILYFSCSRCGHEQPYIYGMHPRDKSKGLIPLEGGDTFYVR